jgi:hypothetical protein
LRVKFSQVCGVVFLGKGFGQRAGCLTKRAADLWESARFLSLFLALSFSRFRAESTPAHKPLTQTVRPHAFFSGFGYIVEWELLFLLAIRFSLQSSLMRFGFSLGFWFARQFFLYAKFSCMAAGFAHWLSWLPGWFRWLFLFRLWCLARNRLIISAGILARLSWQQSLEPRPVCFFLVC